MTNHSAAPAAEKSIDEMTDAEFDAAYGGRELLPIEQAIYEAEGAERFAKFHLHGRTFPQQAEVDVERWVSKLNKLSRQIDGAAEGIHPEVAMENTKELREEFKRIATTTESK